MRTPEAKAKRNAYMAEFRARPENKAKAKALRAAPERKAKVKAHNAKPEVKARRVAYFATYNAKPEVQEKAAARRATPEYKAKQAVRGVKAEAKRKHERRRSTPEAKAKQKAYRARPEVRAKHAAYLARPEVKAHRQEARREQAKLETVRQQIKAYNRKRRDDKASRPRPEVCDVCRGVSIKGRALHFDHCHHTGAFRGWLCNRCNLALGAVRDNPATLRRLALYLENTAGRETDMDPRYKNHSGATFL